MNKEYQEWLEKQPPPVSIKNNPLRVGNFTSSEIVALTTFAKNGIDLGKPALTYISECNMERRLGRSLNDETKARALSWGSLVEKRVFELLGIEYKDGFDVTVQHKTIPYWCGSQDGNKFDEGNTVFEVKCPLTLKSFCELVDCATIQEIRENHKDGEKFYWQIVSNAILTDSIHGELIVYLPYKSELDAIRELASDFDGNQNKIAWIGFAQDDELPFLLDGGYYKNLNILRFEIPEADKYFLTERVIEAGKLLIQFHQ